MALLSKEVESSPIEIDSGVEEVNSKDPRRTSILRTRAYKLSHKRQRKLTSPVWGNFTFMEPNEEGNL